MGISVAALTSILFCFSIFFVSSVTGKQGHHAMNDVVKVFEKNTRGELESTLDSADWINNVLEYIEPEMPKEGTGELIFSRRKVDAEVKRWPYAENADDPPGSGFPICVAIDGVPKRFKSWTCFVKDLKQKGMTRRMFQFQKGDCADAIENKLLHEAWGKPPTDNCDACSRERDTCALKICVADSLTKKAKTFGSPCEAMKFYHDRKDATNLWLSLGECSQLLNPDTCLFTEFFDLDSPCIDGDKESAIQNLAYVKRFTKTAPFRMCPASARSPTEINVVNTKDVPYSDLTNQKIVVDLLNQRVTCLNKDNDLSTKPKAPSYWFHRKILCDDFKIQHCCKCTFGCQSEVADEYTIQLPDTKTLFDDCHWKPFFSADTPYSNTWDLEYRARTIKKDGSRTYIKHACGADKFAPMFIDARTVEDDTPFYETGESILKATPTYGLACTVANQPHGGKCSDYKVRYCCGKTIANQWGDWTPWTQCSRSCGEGTMNRTRSCEKLAGSSEDCFRVKGQDGETQQEKCSLLPCPNDATWTLWEEWSACSASCGTAERRRRRRCTSGAYGGSQCPDYSMEREKYIEVEKCNNAGCPEYFWTPWSSWTECTRTCGVGQKTSTRKCKDYWTDQMVTTQNCYGGRDHKSEDCAELEKCPVNGDFTAWMEWSPCDVNCGKGKRHSVRYCADPEPGFGGKECTGSKEKSEDCFVKSCPVNCLWSEWGEWLPCSVTCGEKGEGVRSRFRHIAIKAEHGGRECDATDQETDRCIHKTENGDIGIPFCPVNCAWGDWSQWSQMSVNCIEYGQDYHQRAFEVNSYRFERQWERNGGMPCEGPRTRVKTNNREDLPRCELVWFWEQWSSWSVCQGQCGKRGKMERRRTCSSAQREIDMTNQKCEGGQEAALQATSCPDTCPPVAWGEWEEWSRCNTDCGKGTQTRRRFCPTDELHKGSSSLCVGEKEQKRRCDLGACRSLAKVEASSCESVCAPLYTNAEGSTWDMKG